MLKLMQQLGGWQAFATPIFSGLLAALLLSGTATATDLSLAEADQVLLEVDRSTRVARLTRERQQDAQGNLSDTLAQATLMREHYRTTHDPRYLGFAGALLGPWLADEATPVEVLILQADLYQAEHNFDLARDFLQRAALQIPADARIWNMLAAIELTTGHHDAARSACARLLTVSRPLIATGCAAQVAGVSGNAKSAYTLLLKTLQREAGEAKAIKAWGYGLLADLAWRLGEVNAAADHFESALALDADNITLQHDYALFLIFNQRTAEALALARDEPQLLLAKTLALANGGANPDFHRARDKQRQLFEAAQRRGETGHAREQALFELYVEDNPARAVELALENWLSQREPVDLWLLASAASSSSSQAALATVNAWIAATGIEDARLAGIAGPGS